MSDALGKTQDEDEGQSVSIGSYVLETLTTGMYVEPRDCIREYVQNSFDAIEGARRDKLLPANGGEILVTMGTGDQKFISIRDDGGSIPSAQVWDTLTSVGASRKSPRKQAGFRGIGRLAGIAYCDILRFTCKFKGEGSITIVEFDCAAIREGLTQGNQLGQIFLKNISITTAKADDARSHFTEVAMLGMMDAPLELRTATLLFSYLQNVAPVDFSEGWQPRQQILDHARSAASGIPTVRVRLAVDGAEPADIRKPYSDVSFAGRKRLFPVNRIAFMNGAYGSVRWWGWYAQTPLYGAINGPEVAGLRVRVRNIQLDGTDIVARLMSRISSSYERFALWHIGEIHVELVDNSVIPNARRDGFENSLAWREIENQLVDALTPLASEAYEKSKTRTSKDFVKVASEVKREIEEIERIVANGETQTSETGKDGLARKIRSTLKRAESAPLDDYTEDQQTELREAMVQLRAIAESWGISLTGRKQAMTAAMQTPSEQPYPEFLDVVFETLTPILDTRTFNLARKALIDRFAG